MEVVLIGKGPGKELAPRKGDGVITWGVNDVCAERECDMVFWMDRHLLRNSPMDARITAAVNTSSTPMYSVETWDDIPSSIPYPIREITEYFGGIDYFADSLCYMIALALYQDFKTITLYGFNYMLGEKYIHEKPCISFWLGMAIASGVTLNIRGDYNQLLDTVDKLVYSYQTPQTMSKENLKFAPVPRVPINNIAISFSVQDRVNLVSILPQMGSYDVMKFTEGLRTKLIFPFEDQVKLNLRVLDAHTDTPKMMWDKVDYPEKIIEFTFIEFLQLRAIVETLNTEKKIAPYNFSLYEKVCKQWP